LAKAGRKSVYDLKVKPRLETIRAWKRRGLLDKQIFENLGISHESFYKYKREHVEFTDALKEGLDDAIANVENAHYKSAIGFDYVERKIVKEPTGEKDEDGKPIVKRRIEITRKRVAPNVTAQIHFLKNRKSDDWHDRKEYELYGKDGKDISINVTHEKPEDAQR